MLFRNRKLCKGIQIYEGFDEQVPMARAIRSLLPEDSRMDTDARERMMGHLLSVQRAASRGKAARTPARRALLPALAVFLVLVISAAVLLPTFLLGKKTPKAQPHYASFEKLVGDVQVRTTGASWKKASM